jgi:hypothetical protein
VVYMDKVLRCLQCGCRFTFTASEENFFAIWGFTNAPGRCPECRGVRNEWRRGSTLAVAIQALIQSGK